MTTGFKIKRQKSPNQHMHQPRRGSVLFLVIRWLAGDVNHSTDRLKYLSMKNDLSFTRECIHNLSENFRINPDLYFNESDLQSCLFALLLKKFNGENEINNINVWGTDKKKKVRTVSTRKLHSELLLPEGRIDLAVLELENIRFAVNSRGRNPYFQVEEGNHIFIEIKASRTNRSNISSKNRWYKLIASDIEKLNKYTNEPISKRICKYPSGKVKSGEVL